MTPLGEWESFYVIVGSSAGALIGLQFIAITLIADMPARKGQEMAGAAFATIIHFSVVLVLSALLSAPWHEITGAAIFCTLLGLGGIIYEVVVYRRMRTQSVYKPEFEDWLFHVLLPLAAYAILTGSGYTTRLHVERALFGVAAAALLLLLIGIHNTWDAVMYHVFTVRQREAEKPKQQ